MGDDSVKINLHELYLSLDDGVLQKAWDEAAKRGDKDEAVFWRKALDAWTQPRLKAFIESGRYYG